MKASDAEVSFSINGNDAGVGGAPNGTINPAFTQKVAVSGEVKIKDFQWPEIIAIGAAYDVSDKLMIAADYKRIMWSKVMQDFNMSFVADAVQADPGAAAFAGADMNMNLNQDWEDQNVLLIGAAYKVSDPLTLRAGLNLANNPVPDEYMNPLFPAIIKNHVTLGVGYAVSDASNINFSLVYAPPVTQTTDYGQSTPTGDGVEVTHSQTSSQLMYSYVF